ncbi:uncharacterized protein LOC119731725 [Patiria miniata]|uniref:Death domain-containing protein n=1 Tax=Patiria miniata TaxID=46514 RepID=A0A914AAU0_PATMI|nr:uncharacterized protein LOC119731725 [Patiria miniata]
MDEADCCSLPKGLRPAMGLGGSGDEGFKTGKHAPEEIFRDGTAQKGPWSALPYPAAGEPLDCRLANGASRENESYDERDLNGREWSHTPGAVDQCNDAFTLESFQTGESVKSQNHDHLDSGCHHLMTEPTPADRYDRNTCEMTSLADCSVPPHGDGSRDDASSRGVDETDQGQVLPTLNLPGVNAEYSRQHPSSQYYANPEGGLPKSPRLDATVTESSGPRSNRLQSAIGEAFRNNDAVSSRAISHTGATTAQGHLQPNSKPSPESSPQEVAKRKASLAEERGVDVESVMKKQRVSPTVQSDVQYNQNVLSMPKEYKVRGTGNYIFDSPSNCTFNLYQNHSGSQSQKQHAFEWAGVASQTDSGCDEGDVPAQALETVAKLVANTTNWKTFARRLPMSENGNLESDIKTLEDCQGTTSDKTAAVLMRWWKEHPKQGDAVAMKMRLKEGLECCSLIRLARTLDKYL